ncbi:MAG: hypothetical protein IKS31_02740 [Clostridia bacterium]|nr:hypothetical protein [Clostridia bacterium]MBR4457858.1 hypothetical protein [Clostridia bacterium]
MTENNMHTMDEPDDLDELESLFGTPESELEQAEKIELTQNLEGFASCFPDWDLHPPLKY